MEDNKDITFVNYKCGNIVKDRKTLDKLLKEFYKHWKQEASLAALLEVTETNNCKIVINLNKNRFIINTVK